MSEDRPGGAAFCEYTVPIDYTGAGGGMSASENRMANYRGKTIGDFGPAKSTTGGKDTSRNAKNVIMKLDNGGDLNDLPGHMDEVTPSSTRHSRNRGENSGSRSANAKVNAKG